MNLITFTIRQAYLLATAPMYSINSPFTIGNCKEVPFCIFAVRFHYQRRNTFEDGFASEQKERKMKTEDARDGLN